jgi:hypothetical protein
MKRPITKYFIISSLILVLTVMIGLAFDRGTLPKQYGQNRPILIAYASEPYAFALVGAGIAGIALYLHHKDKKKK